MSSYRHEPRRVEKPWGFELIWAEAEEYVGKLLFVRAGHALSLQYHDRKDESWFVQEGRATVELGEVDGPPETPVPEDLVLDLELEVIEIGPGDAFRFRPRTVHRITAIEDTLVLEVSTPHLEDVVRIDDRYGRP